MTEHLPSLKAKVETVRDLLIRNREHIQMALPAHLPLDRLLRAALTSFSTTPKLLDCNQRSFLGAVIQCAQLGLEPGVLGMAYLVPFGKEVTLIPGYRGMLALARRSKEISTIEAHAVYAEDAFAYRFGLNPLLDHTPSDKLERGELTHVYAVCKLKDGGSQFDVMTRAEVDGHRDRYSRAAQQGPWQTAYSEMARKTILKRLCKVLPASIELMTAVNLSDRAEVQLSQGLEDLAPYTNGGTEPPSALDKLTTELGAGEEPTP